MPSRSPIRVLLIEDEEQFVDILSRIFGAWPVTITTADTEAEAIRLLGEGEFEVAIVDIRLHDSEGSALLRFLSKQPAAVTARCVIVTSFPLVGKAWTDLPVVDKWRLGDLGPHLYRLIGPPPQPEPVK